MGAPNAMGYGPVLEVALMEHMLVRASNPLGLNGAPRVWAEKYIFCAQNTDETATRLYTVATSQWEGGQMELY